MAYLNESKISVTVDYKELFDIEPHISIAQYALQALNLTSVLITLAEINGVLQTWRRTFNSEIDRQLAIRFLPCSQSRLRTILRRVPNAVFFSRLGILAAMRLALQYCPASGKQVSTPQDVGIILACCVLANDLSHPAIRTVNPLETTITNHIHLHDATVRTLPEADVVRSLIPFEEHAQTSSNKNKSVDFKSLFTSSVGIGPRIFAEICFSISSRYLSLDSEVFTNANRIFFDSEFFAQTNLPKANFEDFLKNVAISANKFASVAAEVSDGSLSDLRLFQTYPLIDMEDGRYFCLDVSCLLEKAGRGMFWTLRKAIPDDLAGGLLRAYGYLFESYLRSLLPVKVGTGIFIPDPKFANGDEAFDALMLEGSDLVVFEFKSSVLAAIPKYGGQPQDLFDEIKKKFVVGGSHAKGVKQIEKALKRFFSGDAIGDILPSSVRRVHAVMIVLETTMTMPFISRYVNERFERRALAKEYHRKITPVTIIDVQNFERLTPYIEQYGLPKLLDSYYAAHVRPTSDQITPIAPENIPFLQNRPPLPDKVAEKFRNFAASLVTRLFGAEKEEDFRARFPVAE